MQILIFLSLISFSGAIVYRLYALNNIGVIISVILAIIVFFIIQRFKPKSNSPLVTHSPQLATHNKKINFLLIAIYSLLVTSCFFILFKNQTTSAIISPWQVIPNYFFVFYALATSILIFIAIKYQNKLTIFLIIAHYFLSFSVALIIYKIGYGFDPFIHTATMDLIDKTGSVSPKPFYYLGQYSLIIILHKITFIKIALLNKLLVPALASIYIPIILYHALSGWLENNKINILLIISSLILPFPFFISTTPQNLSYLFLIITILLGIKCASIYDLIIIYLLSLTALVTQPIAGIPAICFSLFLTVYHIDNKKLKKYFYLLIFIFTSISLPLAFYLFEKNNYSEISTPAEKISQSILPVIPRIIIPGEENFILNFIYLYGFNLKIILATLIIFGIFIACKNKSKCKLLNINLIIFIGLMASYLLTQELSFNFLIEYERDDYLNRILVVAVLFLLPFIFIALYSILEKIIKQNKIIKNFLFLFLIILITTSFYFSYPRFDNYFNSHGYSVSENDIKAVRFIEESNKNDYIVLANQQVSVAALREFGFAKYYKNNIFYYPIPTGEKLYQYYLDMVYKKPSKETVVKAMNLAGVSEAYFVLNKYWWASLKILEEAKLEADEFYEIGDGEIYIFKYTK
ncbi:MAG: hypothetical protein ABIA02_01900 [Candidatus Falkowbacteria bacterium]